MSDFDKVLGVLEHEKKDIGKGVEKLIADREAARAAKDWKKADEIRDKINSMGIILEDSKNGVKWKIRD